MDFEDYPSFDRDPKDMFKQSLGYKRWLFNEDRLQCTTFVSSWHLHSFTNADAITLKKNSEIHTMETVIVSLNP